MGAEIECNSETCTVSKKAWHSQEETCRRVLMDVVDSKESGNGSPPQRYGFPIRSGIVCSADTPQQHRNRTEIRVKQGFHIPIHDTDCAAAGPSVRGVS